MKFSSLLTRFSEPETLKMARLARELRASGADIIDLSLGEPDFDTPEHIKEAAIQAIHDNWSHYTPVAGFVDLKQAVCNKFLRDNNLSYQPENIVVSTGAKQSIANVMLALVESGDEVIVPTPYWVTYSEIVKIAGGTVKFIKTSLEANYKISPEQLEAAINEKTKAFIFSSPSNPTGAIYSRDELKALAAVFARHPQVFIISDEIYEYINFVGKHESIASFEEVKEQTIIVNGLSKGFAMTGWRLGFIAANAAVAKAAEKIQGQFTSGTNSIAQRAAITALESDSTATKQMVAAFAERRKKVLELLKEIKGFDCNTPEGAFYLFPKISAHFGRKYTGTTIHTAEDLSMYLLHEAHVSSVSGAAFGQEECIRFSFANNLKNLEEGFRRIALAIDKLK